MFHVHSPCISNMNIKAISNQRVNSKYRVEPEGMNSNDNDILN